MKILTTEEAAKKLGISARRVRALIESGALPAQLLGKTWIIQSDDLAKVKHRPTGRPTKYSKRKI